MEALFAPEFVHKYLILMHKHFHIDLIQIAEQLMIMHGSKIIVSDYHAYFLKQFGQLQVKARPFSYILGLYYCLQVLLQLHLKK